MGILQCISGPFDRTCIIVCTDFPFEGERERDREGEIVEA